MQLAPTIGRRVPVLSCACVSNPKGVRRELLTARGDHVWLARRAIRSICDNGRRTSCFNSLRARMVGTERDAVLRVPEWRVALHKLLETSQRSLYLIATGVRSKSDIERWRDISARQSCSTGTQPESIGLSGSWSTGSRIYRKRNALGAGRDSQRLMFSRSGSALWWRAVFVESTSRSLRQSLLCEPELISSAGRLAGLRMVGARTEPRLRFWKRVMGSNQAQSRRDSALCSGRSRSWQWRTRRTRGRCVQQWMVPLE